MFHEMGLPEKLTLLYLLVFPAISMASNLKIYSHQFGPFHSSDYDTFSVLPDATISNKALQILPDSANQDYSLKNKSGRIMLSKSFKLWEGEINSTSERIASFNSTIYMTIFPINSAPGEGLAFVIAPDLNIPSGSDGQYLGLTNATTDGNSTNHLIAIEFDTVKQDFDPDNNHVGLNINSIRSTKTRSLTDFNFNIVSPEKSANNIVWVQYDGQEKLLKVYFQDPIWGEPVLTANLNIREYVKQYSYFGFAASTGNLTQLNSVVKWTLEVEMLEKVKKPTWVKIVVGVGVVVICLAAGSGYYLHKRIRGVDDPNMLGALKSLPGMPREFRFKDLKKATNNFDEKLKLGQGGFGVVYKGVLPKDNIQVAVKKFSRENMKGKDDFLAELTIINRLRHKHLVRLVGWCHKSGMLLLVYDYMVNGSLDNHLFGGPEKTLIWDLRNKIISDIASALQYLHYEYDQKVVHRDLKASNIMLDSDFNARLGDFGLARALDNEKTSYAELGGVPGTMGYIAPECILTGKATRDSDVFGFGAVVLEVVCGKRPWSKIVGFQFLVDWVWMLHREGRILEAIDERLGGNYEVEEAERLLLLGLACSHPVAKDRPKTQDIHLIISGSVPVPYVPPFKPAFVWPGTMMGPTEDGSVVNTADTMPMTSSYYVGR